MKNLLSSLVLIVLLFTTNVFAGYIESDDMEVIKSSPIVGNSRHADIDVVSNPMHGSTEVFCVEKKPALKGINRYDFYTIDQTNYYDKKGNDITAKKMAQLKQASWYANWFLNESNSSSSGDIIDEKKAIAQIAIWGALEAIKNYNGPYAEEVAALLLLYINAEDKDAYMGDWALAVSPGDGTPIVWNEPGQNFLVNIGKTPEPTTVLSFGLGLIGLTGINRKKFIGK